MHTRTTAPIAALLTVGTSIYGQEPVQFKRRTAADGESGRGETAGTSATKFKTYPQPTCSDFQCMRWSPSSFSTVTQRWLTCAKWREHDSSDVSTKQSTPPLLALGPVVIKPI